MDLVEAIGGVGGGGDGRVVCAARTVVLQHQASDLELLQLDVRSAPLQGGDPHGVGRLDRLGGGSGTQPEDPIQARSTRVGDPPIVSRPRPLVAQDVVGDLQALDAIPVRRLGQVGEVGRLDVVAPRSPGELQQLVQAVRHRIRSDRW